MPGTYTPDELRSVRLNIPDTEAIYGDGQDEYIFEDDDIALFLDQASGQPMFAAGLAMVAVGNSEALIGKVIRNYETQTDASKLQREWRSAGIAMIELGRSLLVEGAGFWEVVYPDWGENRHPEGESHGGYRLPPSSWQW
jgi:hypothetical protein